LIKDFHNLKDLSVRRILYGFNGSNVALMRLNLQGRAAGIAFDLAFIVIIGIGKIHLESA
jgi:hypothetical protein